MNRFARSAAWLAVTAALAAPFDTFAQTAFGELGRARGSADTSSDGAAFAETRVEVYRHGIGLALRDMTGDGKLELLQIDAGTLGVRQLAENGTYEPRSTLLPWTTPTVGWDLADLEGDGRTELILVTDGKTVTRRRFDARNGWGDPETLFEVEVYLPSGVARVPFARDIDGDGRLDLVLPGPGRFFLYLNRGIPEGGGPIQWSERVEVAYEPDIAYELGNPERLSSTFGQSVSVPLFTMTDIDGDGRQDLVSELDDRVAFHLAAPEISTLPTWELDLSKLKNKVSASDIDLDDLLSIASGWAQWRIEDLDGVAPNDLVIGSEGTFRVWLGASTTGPVGDPDQVLKASGNVLYFLVRDVLGDARPDLQIVRGERVSLARLLKYLVVPGKLDFDVFTYVNEGGKFAPKVTKRTTIALRIPRLLGMIDDFEEISDALEEQWDIPARRFDWDGDGQENDVVDARDGQLLVYTDCAPTEQRFENVTLQRGLDGLIERVVLSDLEDLDDGGVSVIDLGALNTFFVAPGKGFRDATVDRGVSAAHPLWEGKDDRGIRPIDLDGDGRSDFIVVIESENNTYRVQFLVRK